MNIQVILVTCPDLKCAKKIASILVEEKLAACVNIIKNIESIYLWNGKIQNSKEILLIIKSTAKLSNLEAKIIKLHPYSVPEFIVIEPKHINKKYADWVKDCTK